MPVPLPVPPPPGIDLPVPSQSPPTHADVVAAKSFQADVDAGVASQRADALRADDAARADVYKTSVVVAHAAQAAAPAWFVPAMQAVMPGVLNPLLAPMKVMLAQTRNHQLHDGRFINFSIVPFNDGTMPTEAPHNLPPLLNIAAIRALTAAQSTAYVVGYGLGNVGNAPARRVAIGRAIGCSTAV